MVSLLIISCNLFLFLLFPSIVLSDDNLENISVNTGETATFICDLPERYSNKAVSSIFINKICLHRSHKGNIYIF